MGVRIVVERGIRVPPSLLSALSRRIERAGRALGLSREACAAVGVRLVDDPVMERIHAQHLGYRKATDVLSFPGESEETPGDLVLNVHAVARQAAGPTAEAWLEEASQLCVHGLVHLLGHDHATRLQARRMLALEKKAARAAGIAEPRRPY